ncbi:MAG TPA: CcmD family protein [Puia sp.]|nr:CcmD family protein [Puia sp.]
MLKKFCFLMLLLPALFLTLIARAQDSSGDQTVEMADALRANGKIYVVVAVLVAIFLGLILYVVRLDRKISRLEKETK